MNYSYFVGETIKLIEGILLNYSVGGNTVPVVFLPT